MKFTIGIPTYNRKEQLIDQLNSIFCQDLSAVKEIIIVDNNSEYDIHDIEIKYNSDKLRIIKNSINVGMNVNMSNPFLYSTTDWFWLLSDDDLTLNNSIEKIEKEISRVSEDVGLIKFSLSGQLICNQKESTVSSLEDFINYYYQDENIRRGDLVFISTNVYNLKILKDYITYAFEYSYTYIGFLIPVLFGLNDSKIKVYFSNSDIVKYVPPRGKNYSFFKVGKGLSTISHLPLSLSLDYRKKFLNLFMSISPRTLLVKNFEDDYRINNRIDLEIIYNNVYRYSSSFKTKLFFKFILLLMQFKFMRKLLLNLSSK